MIFRFRANRNKHNLVIVSEKWTYPIKISVELSITLTGFILLDNFEKSDFL